MLLDRPVKSRQAAYENKTHRPLLGISRSCWCRDPPVCCGWCSSQFPRRGIAGRLRTGPAGPVSEPREPGAVAGRRDGPSPKSFGGVRPGPVRSRPRPMRRGRFPRPGFGPNGTGPGKTHRFFFNMLQPAQLRVRTRIGCSFKGEAPQRALRRTRLWRPRSEPDRFPDHRHLRANASPPLAHDPGPLRSLATRARRPIPSLGEVACPVPCSPDASLGARACRPVGPGCRTRRPCSPRSWPTAISMKPSSWRWPRPKTETPRGVSSCIRTSTNRGHGPSLLPADLFVPSFPHRSHRAVVWPSLRAHRASSRARTLDVRFVASHRPASWCPPGSVIAEGRPPLVRRDRAGCSAWLPGLGSA